MQGEKKSAPPLENIGIRHYSTTAKGIGGEIKKRISDFIVAEITLKGEVLENRAFGEWDDKRETKLEVPENPEGKEYLHLTLEKFNMDTNNALRMVARQLHSSPKRVGYAGMKDKRAITSQRISIWKPDIELLEGFKSRYVDLREPEWSGERIEIGSLTGNMFRIVVRNIETGREELEKTARECIEEMQKGVANYFGEQRFGGIRQITHRVGKEFILGNMEEAVMLYLTSPAEGEEEEIAAARKNLLGTKDFAKASREFPSKFRYERAIIHHLCKYPNDFVGAFQKLPKHLTYMFTHAYQSYLFNEIISERIARGIGLKEAKGDVLDDGIVTVPLIGFETKNGEGIEGEIEKEILEKEGITTDDFKVNSFPELSCSGTRKKIKVVPKGMKLLEIGDDEVFEGKSKLAVQLTLGKGDYATTILRELMKN